MLPPGTRMLSEGERVEALKTLEETKKLLEQELQKMPLSMKTMGQAKKKKELEDKIIETEKGIQTFSKKKVYISIE